MWSGCCRQHCDGTGAPLEVCIHMSCQGPRGLAVQHICPSNVDPHSGCLEAGLMNICHACEVFWSDTMAADGGGQTPSITEVFH